MTTELIEPYYTNKFKIEEDKSYLECGMNIVLANYGQVDVLNPMRLALSLEMKREDGRGGRHHLTLENQVDQLVLLVETRAAIIANLPGRSVVGVFDKKDRFLALKLR